MKLLLACLLGLAPPLAAFSSHELWLGGTRPYETVPYKELDAEAHAAVSQEGSGTGLRLEYGILDHWMLLGNLETFGSVGLGYSAGSRLRFSENGKWPLDAAVFYEFSSKASIATQQFGAVLARELGEHSFSIEGGLDEKGASFWGAGYKTPFLYWALRAGADIRYAQGAAAWPVTPQLSFLLPGDISLQAGVRLGDAPPLWLFSLSYEIFPSP